MRFLYSGELNHRLGWLLLIAALAWAIWLDPWSFSERNPGALAGSAKTAAMHAQSVVLVMAFLQLAIGATLVLSPPQWQHLNGAGLLGLGGMIVAAGHALGSSPSVGGPVILSGVLLSLLGFVTFIHDRRGKEHRDLTVILWVLSAGMFLIGIMAMFELRPELFLPAYLGAEDGFRMRLLRLARIAVIALSTLTVLFLGLAKRASPQSRIVHWGRLAMLGGTIGIPSVLIAAALTRVELTTLLPIPAYAMLAGTLCGTQLARRSGRSLEVWGWMLIAIGMAGGLFMGLYAFDAWLPADWLGPYNGFGRRLIRLAHIDCVVFGLTSIFVARELASWKEASWLQRLGAPLLIAGSATTIAVLLLLTWTDLPATVMSVGPAIVTTAVLLCAACALPGGLSKAADAVASPGVEL
ncbi:MAG TPA: hypothetical protein VFU31_07410 [Candidatus Binatia bacterium]|nr:hypothetical protein [Candidatus Binatia bacterium]